MCGCTKANSLQRKPGHVVPMYVMAATGNYERYLCGNRDARHQFKPPRTMIRPVKTPSPLGL